MQLKILAALWTKVGSAHKTDTACGQASKVDQAEFELAYLNNRYSLRSYQSTWCSMLGSVRLDAQIPTYPTGFLCFSRISSFSQAGLT